MGVHRSQLTSSIHLSGSHRKKDESFEGERLSTPPTSFTLNSLLFLIRGEKEGEIAKKEGRQEARPRLFPTATSVRVSDTDSDVVTPGHYLIQPPFLSQCVPSVFSPPPPSRLTPALHKAICSVDFSDYLCRTRSGSFKPLCLSQPLQMR